MNKESLLKRIFEGRKVALIAMIFAVSFSGLACKDPKKERASDAYDQIFGEGIVPSAPHFNSQPPASAPQSQSGPTGVVAAQNGSGPAANSPGNFSNEEILGEIAKIRKDQEALQVQVNQKLSEHSSSSSSPSAKAFIAPRDIQERMDPEYQGIVKHFKSTENVWEMDAGKYEALSKKANLLVNVSSQIKDLYPTSSKVGGVAGFSFKIPAGTRLTCVTDQPIKSDFVGFFTATIRRPDALNGCKFIGQIGPQNQDRIPTKGIAIVNTKGLRTDFSENQVEMTFPGLAGEVKSHWGKRIWPAIANAAIGGGAAVALINNQKGTTTGDNISTRDLVAAPLIESSVQSLQGEISRLGGDYPNTVDVCQGTNFNVLLIQGLEIEL